MPESKISIFDMVLLIVGIGASILGFQLINQAYQAESGRISWFMIIAIFTWLTLLVMFILLSVIVDVSKKQLNELKNIVFTLSENKKKKIITLSLQLSIQFFLCHLNQPAALEIYHSHPISCCMPYLPSIE